MSAPKVIFLGTAGSGKGTQAQRLSDNLGLIHISTGDLLREARDTRTPLGLEAERFIASGDLVPDELMLELIQQKLADPNIQKNGLILDGFPRTIAQGEGLTRLTEARKCRIDKVFLFNISLEETIERLGGRRICGTCSRIFHVKFNPANAQNHSCDGTLKKRVDDTEAKIRYRYEVYSNETAPLIDYYQDRIIQIDATQNPDQIYQEICDHLVALKE